MRRPVECRCCTPGCAARVCLVPFATVGGVVDLTEGLCRKCLGRAAPDRRAVLAQARLELRIHSGLAQVVLLVQAWEAVKMSALERSSYCSRQVA